MLLRSTIVTLFASLLFASSHLYAQENQTTETTTTTTKQTAAGPVTVEKRTITTTVPAPKETIETPTGFVSCTSMPAGWFNNVWVPARRVCKYSNSAEGVDWVEGYWSCTQYTLDSGECTAWNWVPAHWEKAYTGY